MKTLILILAFAAAAVAQQTVPCLTNDGNGWTVPAAAGSTPFKIAAGGQYVVPVSMPVAGRCVGSFAAFDDRDDVAVVVTDNLGRYIRTQPKGDIEIIVLDTVGLQRRNAGQSYFAHWTNKSTGGTFDLSLREGVYFFVISNKHSYLAPKHVDFTLGESPRYK